MSASVGSSKYYLEQFFGLIDFVTNRHKDVLKQEHHSYIDNLRALSEDAQCAYVRMISRKGIVFSKPYFTKYREISDPMGALSELEHEGFVSSIQDNNKATLFEFLTKPQLAKWFQGSGLSCRSTISRQELRKLALIEQEQLKLSALPGVEDLVLQQKREELDHLLFLYFGKPQKTLNLYALRKEPAYEVQYPEDQVYVVVDVETTGGSAAFHKITEIGAVKIQNGLIIDEFQTLINPERPIPPFITHITGITDEMVADAPKFSEIAEDFLKFTEGAVFVAHNANFDYSFIREEYQRIGRTFERPVLCTVTGMRRHFPGIKSYGLKNLTQHFQISLESHHRAMCDARAAAELLLLMKGHKEPNIAHFELDEYSTQFPREL